MIHNISREDRFHGRLQGIHQHGILSRLHPQHSITFLRGGEASHPNSTSD